MHEIERSGIQVSSLVVSREENVVYLNNLEFKLTKAAIEEAEATGSDLPLLATTRYLAAPRLERFVSRNVTESLDFVLAQQLARE